MPRPRLGARLSLAPSPAAIRLGIHLRDDEIATLGEGGLVVRDGVLGEALARRCRAAAEALDREGALDAAHLGRARKARPELRGDRTAFLSELALPGPLGELWAGFEALRRALNEGAWLGLRRFEVQLACYPGDGARYVRHLDAFAGDPSRRVTAIYYLNAGWTPADGGLLRAWVGDTVQEVEPRLDRLVVFLSDRVPHEVTPAFAPRYAAAAWFRGAEDVPFLPDPPVRA